MRWQTFVNSLLICILIPLVFLVGQQSQRLDRLERVHGVSECHKVITGKDSSFETPSDKVAEKMIAKGYIVEKCD